MDREEAKVYATILRTQGRSLNDIVDEINIPKSTVQGWVKNIALTPDSRHALKKKQTEAALRGNYIRRKELSSSLKNSLFTKDSAAFFAHIFFDGWVGPDYIAYSTSHLSLANEVIRVGQRVTGLNAKIYKNKNDLYRVSFFSRELAVFTKSFQPRLLNEIINLSQNCHIPFLKAFFNDEGSVCYRPIDAKRVVRGYQKNRCVLELVYKLLKKVSIDSTLEGTQTSPEIVIRGKENLVKFQKLIGFSEGVRFLARRKNSFYTLPIEKKIVLAQAIDSYL